MAPKIDPGGVRRPLACQVGAQRLPKWLPEASGRPKTKFERGRGAPRAIFSKFEAQMGWSGGRAVSPEGGDYRGG